MSTVKDWLEFEHKYKNKLRDFMSEEEEREFINDYSVCCENEGFNRVFWSPYEEQKEHIGKKFKVLRRLNEEECFLDAQPMWEIELEDGTIFSAFPEEIVPSEMKANKCPKKYLDKKENNKMIKTWDEFNEKYDKYDYRENMSKEREREYVNDLFSVYENEGFNKVFWSPYSNEGEEKYYGKTFKVLGRCPETRNNLSLLPLWDIEFEDGKQLTVEPCEIFTEAMKDKGCPEVFLIDEEQENLNCLYARLMIKLQCELFSYKETLYRMTVDEVMDEAYKLTMLKEFVNVFECYAKEELNANQFHFYLRMNNALQFLYDAWLAHDSEEQEIYKRFLFEGWDWSM